MSNQQKNTSKSPKLDEKVVLLLQVPRTNDKKELAAEQMFASLHGLLIFPPEKFLDSAKHVSISFEIAVLKKRIGFYVCVQRNLKEFVEEQIYAQYPTVQIREITDYSASAKKSNWSSVGTEMKLSANDALPIKTFQSFEVDPLAAITATLAKFGEDEEAWIQLLIRPARTNWHKRSERYVSKLRGGSGGGGTGLLSVLWTPPEAGQSGPAKKLTEYEQARAKGAEEKSHKLGFDTVLRIVYRGGVSKYESNLRLQSMVASYKQFATTYMNSFHQGKIITDGSVEARYHRREFARRPFVLNIEEIATLYHLPHTNVETPYILWATSQTSEPPANLPVVSTSAKDDISPIAGATFRGLNTPFGLPRSDRGRHLYILGQTGVGKSALLELLTISDITSPYGFAVIDPHGDYAVSILKRIPKERTKDVIYFNPADVDYPIAFNPMEVTDAKLKTQTASELIGVLKRMFDSWGPRLEYILRYSLLALLEYPNSTMLDITRILTDKKFRKEVLAHVKDPVVKNFWDVEFASWNDKFAAEAVSPVLNKVGAFTANPLVRNIIGQPKSSFNIRQIMDEKKILIVNLSRGVVGEDNAAILGALMVTKMQLGAMSRADIPADQRVPFYLYVDEFQNFATDSFATILSEARKYALNLTVANQYIAQMPQDVKDAVFGNVGSMVAFRMSADDARSMQRYFEPKFTEYDLVHMHNRNFVISMTIEGEKVQAFSGVTLDLPADGTDNSQNIIASSRHQYALSKSEVEDYVKENYIDVIGEIEKSVKKAAKKAKKPTKVINETGPETNFDTKDKPVKKPTNKSESEKANHDEKPSKVERTPENFAEYEPKKDQELSQFVALGHSATSILSTKDSPKKKRRRRRRRKKKITETDNQKVEKPIEEPKVKKSKKPEPTKKPTPKNPPIKKKDNDDEVVIFKR